MREGKERMRWRRWDRKGRRRIEEKRNDWRRGQE
jgi:hypothetical protein